MEKITHVPPPFRFVLHHHPDLIVIPLEPLDFQPAEGISNLGGQVRRRYPQMLGLGL
jgi:hypothetical protein